MIVSTLSGLSLYDGFILHLELSDKTCWSTRNSTLVCPMPFHDTICGIRHWQESIGTFCQWSVGIVMDNNDSTSQSFFTTSFFQRRTSLQYNLPLVIRAFMIFHILPYKQHALSCPPTSLPFIFTSSKASSLSLKITLGIMSPFVLRSLFDTITPDEYLLPPSKKTLPAVQGAQTTMLCIITRSSSRFWGCQCNQRALNIQCDECTLVGGIVLCIGFVPLD